LCGVEQRYVVFELTLKLFGHREIFIQDLTIGFQLRCQLPAGLIKLMQVMEMFDGLFQSNRNQQADGYRRNMNDEVLPRMDRFVGRMNVEHTVSDS
jgi:hypothetical protein